MLSLDFKYQSELYSEMTLENFFLRIYTLGIFEKCLNVLTNLLLKIRQFRDENKQVFFSKFHSDKVGNCSVSKLLALLPGVFNI